MERFFIPRAFTPPPQTRPFDVNTAVDAGYRVLDLDADAGTVRLHATSAAGPRMAVCLSGSTSENPGYAVQRGSLPLPGSPMPLDTRRFVENHADMSGFVRLLTRSLVRTGAVFSEPIQGVNGRFIGDISVNDKGALLVMR
ncbi:hypothetical protein [Paraburkholderia oxyphila]|uniref:hypothetical protein n=1 Tax=Paraburkholderia oxyphila TaxID=614212 RepID=UPI000487A14D|nr:hypothetical protein [Paraburkholderia oxyphila]